MHKNLNQGYLMQKNSPRKEFLVFTFFEMWSDEKVIVFFVRNSNMAEIHSVQCKYLLKPQTS